MTTVMFLGMSFCLPWAYWQEHKHKTQAQEALTSGNGDVRDPLLYGESLVSIAGHDMQCIRFLYMQSMYADMTWTEKPHCSQAHVARGHVARDRNIMLFHTFLPAGQ